MPVRAHRPLEDVRTGTRIFIDANVFVYHFSGPTPLADSSSALLQRIQDGDIVGVTSAVVMVELLHRLMILEAASALQLQPRDATRYLREHPEGAKSLGRHRRAPAAVHAMGVEVAPVDSATIEDSHAVKEQHGFLTNDALVLATMQRLGITALASNDSDFGRVQAITVYRPTEAGT